MENLKINLHIDSNYKLPRRKMDENFDPTGFTHNGVNYIELNEFSRINSGNSVPKLRRLIKRVEHKNCNEYLYRIWNKIYVAPAVLTLQNKSYTCLSGITGNWAVYLSNLKWDYIGAVHFKNKQQLLTANQRMITFFDKLSKRFKTAEIRLFYVCEKNQDDNGFHSHFLLYTNTGQNSEVKSFTENHFRGNGESPFANTWIDTFQPSKDGIPYILKEIHLYSEGMDLLWKNKS